MHSQSKTDTVDQPFLVRHSVPFRTLLFLSFRMNEAINGICSLRCFLSNFWIRWFPQNSSTLQRKTYNIFRLKTAVMICLNLLENLCFNIKPEFVRLDSSGIDQSSTLLKHRFYAVIFMFGLIMVITMKPCLVESMESGQKPKMHYTKLKNQNCINDKHAHLMNLSS